MASGSVGWHKWWHEASVCANAVTLHLLQARPPHVLDPASLEELEPESAGSSEELA